MVTRCKHGHWYDSGMYKSCPHCKQAGERLGLWADDIEEDDHTVPIAEAGLFQGEELDALIRKSSGRATPQEGGDGEEEGQEDGDKTIAFGFFGMAKKEPVTGWLVCMTGSERGQDYRLHVGKNFIGRSPSMDVVLTDDKAISRKKHCSVIYEPKESTFYVAPEEGNPVYLNDQLLKTIERLKEGDKIMVGDTSLIFVPFNREGRKWEEE